MICRQCGKNLPDKAKFCIGCGLPTQQAASPQIPIQPAARPRQSEAIPAAISYTPQAPAWPEQPELYAPQQPAYPPRQPDRLRSSGGQGLSPAGLSRALEPVDENIVESRRPGSRGRTVPVGLRILSVFLCILLVASGITLSALLALRWSYSPSQVKSLVNAVDLRSIEIPMEDGSTLKLIPFLENQAGIDLEKDYGVTDREVDTVLDQPFMKDFLGGVVSDYTDYLFFGASLNALTRNRMVDFFRENDREIERYTGFSFREHENDLIYTADSYLDHYDLDAIFDNSLHAREISEEYLQQQTGVNLDLIRSFLSTWIVAISAVLAVLLILLIFLTLFRSPRSAVLCIGVSFAVLGGLDLLAGLAGKLWLNTQKIELVKLALQPFLNKLSIIGIAVLVLGLMLVVARLFLRKPARDPE